MNPLIEKAIKACKTQKQLADAVGVHQSFVSQWLNDERPVPPTKCRAIEVATSGLVTVEELRPDVFGQPSLKPDIEAA